MKIVKIIPTPGHVLVGDWWIYMPNNPAMIDPPISDHIVCKKCNWMSLTLKLISLIIPFAYISTELHIQSHRRLLERSSRAKWSSVSAICCVNPNWRRTRFRTCFFIISKQIIGAWPAISEILFYKPGVNSLDLICVWLPYNSKIV